MNPNTETKDIKAIPPAPWIGTGMKYSFGFSTCINSTDKYIELENFKPEGLEM